MMSDFKAWNKPQQQLLRLHTSLSSIANYSVRRYLGTGYINEGEYGIPRGRSSWQYSKPGDIVEIVTLALFLYFFIYSVDPPWPSAASGASMAIYSSDYSWLIVVAYVDMTQPHIIAAVLMRLRAYEVRNK
ncbi:hypothetical protein R3P38DRAFT_1114396 [Favolaschia claudopus]|uniref:Uncharacterized protein n=1 Tax=Favolaschia claudopus TaxID=2862362 RepID=A0AAW0B8Y2_9AGAR